MYTTEGGLISEPNGVWLCLICVLLPDGQVPIMYIFVFVTRHEFGLYMYMLIFFLCVHTTGVGLSAKPKGVWLCLICLLLPVSQVLILYIYIL